MGKSFFLRAILYTRGSQGTFKNINSILPESKRGLLLVSKKHIGKLDVNVTYFYFAEETRHLLKVDFVCR